MNDVHYYIILLQFLLKSVNILLFVVHSFTLAWDFDRSAFDFTSKSKLINGYFLREHCQKSSEPGVT